MNEYMTEPDLSTIVKVYPSKILRPILTVVIAVVIVWYTMTISISSIVIIIFFVLYILFELVLSVVVPIQQDHRHRE